MSYQGSLDIYEIVAFATPNLAAPAGDESLRICRAFGISSLASLP